MYWADQLWFDREYSQPAPRVGPPWPALVVHVSGRRYTLLRGLRIVFQDAPVAAPIRALAALATGAATGPLLVLATERFIATALEVARAHGRLPRAAPVVLLIALFAVQILETVVRGLADARIETGLRPGFSTDLTAKRPAWNTGTTACSASCYDLARYALTVRDNVILGLPERDGGELVGASRQRARPTSWTCRHYRSVTY